MAENIARFTSSRFVGAGTISRFTARDEDLDALLDSDVDHIDVVALKGDNPEPYWQKQNLTTASLYQGSPQAWDQDAIGYLWEHRIAWLQEDDTGVQFEPAGGQTVSIFFYLWRTGGLGPAIVLHEANYVGSPRFAVAP